MSYGGYSDPTWMAKAVLVNADPKMLKLSVSSLIDWLDSSDAERHLCAYTIVDRLLQVMVTGRYDPRSEEACMMSESADESVDKFLTDLDDPDKLNDFLGNNSEGEEDE